MTQLLELEPEDRVLEIGTGSGYAAAILSRIVAAVHTVERHAALARGARAVFERLGYDNIRVHEGDGSLGWPAEGPYDAIVVTAAAPEVPASLKRQLAVGGRLVIPVGSGRLQELLRIRRTGEDAYEQEQRLSVRFVPLVGAEGWRLKRGPSGSSMRPRPNSRATISTPSSPASSTNTSGSTRPGR